MFAQPVMYLGGVYNYRISLYSFINVKIHGVFVIIEKVVTIELISFTNIDFDNNKARVKDKIRYIYFTISLAFEAQKSVMR